MWFYEQYLATKEAEQKLILAEIGQIGLSLSKLVLNCLNLFFR